ncbi:O-acyltransferase WSD1-like isoform X2 [Oryza brachyantha]|uniref:O-acyltransferase WSD1-like isoform X2 n=1 Tax=Oryza brachyantha TaxID=4533 RepID=UPI001ADB040D|nr:O-acyltransferase WSD1-like isoform X2 [Oryza brachyantha]
MPPPVHAPMDHLSTAHPASSSASSSTHSTTTPSSLRKRVLSIDTSPRGAPRGSRERESKAQQESAMAEADQAAAAAAETEWERDVEAAVPMSPAGRLFRETHFNCYIVAVIGLGSSVDVAAARAGLEATLVRHPRFCSVQVSNEASKRAKPKWVRTTVNLDNHLIFPELDPTATSANPDQVVEDYMSTLSTQPMDHSRPLWEFHVLDFPTAEAAATVAVRMHHSLGDGVSLLSLLIACTRSAADPARLPALPPAPPRHDGPAAYARRRPPLSAGLLALAAWAWSCLVLAWHTVVDVVCFVATSLFLRDARTPLMGAEGVEFRRKRFVNCTLSLDDVKHVKNAMKYCERCVSWSNFCSIVALLLPQDHREKRTRRKNIRMRSALLVNIRKTPGLHALAEMMNSSKNNAARWGNLIGYIVLPFRIAMYDDPLEYIRQGKRTVDRKKNSLEAIFTYWSGNLIVKLFGIKTAAALCYGMIANTTLSFSSMVGPAEKVEFYGHPIEYIAPSVYGHPHALTIHYQSYMNIIKLVLAVDDAQFPDAHQLLNDFAESLKLIRQAASTKS